MKLPKPPKGLTAEARSFWRSIQSEYEIFDAGGLAVLDRAAEALDSLRAAQAVVRRLGPVVEGPGRSVAGKREPGAVKANPACAVERDSRAAFLGALKQLNLDLEPLKAIGRPAGE